MHSTEKNPTEINKILIEFCNDLVNRLDYAIDNNVSPFYDSEYKEMCKTIRRIQNLPEEEEEIVNINMSSEEMMRAAEQLAEQSAKSAEFSAKMVEQ